MYRVIDRNLANQYGRNVVDTCDTAQERKDSFHVLSAPSKGAVKLIEDEQAGFQAVQQMIHLLARARQASPTRGLRRAQPGKNAGIEVRQSGTFSGLDHPDPLTF